MFKNTVFIEKNSSSACTSSDIIMWHQIHQSSCMLFAIALQNRYQSANVISAAIYGHKRRAARWYSIKPIEKVVDTTYKTQYSSSGFLDNFTLESFGHQQSVRNPPT